MGAVIRNSHGIRKGDRGATAVEFALVLPLFVLLLFGIIDFGRYFFVQHTVQFATREGTRLALVGGTRWGTMSRIDSIIQKIEDNAGLAISCRTCNQCLPYYRLFRSNGLGEHAERREARGLHAGAHPIHLSDFSRHS